MNTERWQRTEHLFHQALEQDDAARAAFLDRECGDDAELRRDVERLLSADRAAARRLDSVVGDAVRSLHRALSPGHRIGPYEILGPLGEGGMGTVYHARRSDDVFHKEVAIKVVKHGLDPASILRRFQRERRILARLEHPSIARVLDGGSTDDGVPYLVMEYVDGHTLPDYAAEHQLGLPARLRLFAQVCDAVHYAHDRQIVHRDLKPGNILVDASGRPRLLDFGIAALVGGEDHAITVTTGGVGLMTPRYASPEQVRGEPVSPASDIYSLGVILYELLTGCAVHRLASDAPAAIVKAVCEDEVQTPSVAAQAAVDNGGGVPVPPHDLAGALDRIVLRAVEKDPDQRYESVAMLAADINRYLDAQPIAASRRTPTRGVRTAFRRGSPAAGLVLAAATIAIAAYFFVPRGRPKAPASAGKVMLAVLPLENLTGSDERSYFVDGLHEEIISRLGRLQPARLGVIARTSVLQYKGTSKPIAQIGRELGASYILEGSVREAGSNIRVTAQLIQVSDQTHLWAETYDRQLRDLFSVQSDIGAHVADSLSVDVLPDALASLEPHQQLSAEAYAAYLRGRYFWNRRALNYPSNGQLAADHFKSVTRAAPNYAPGFAGLAQAYLYLSRYAHWPQEQPLVKEARAAVATALALDGESAVALATLAEITWRIDWDWMNAEAGYRRALAREPNNAEIHQQLAWLVAYSGRHEEGQREIEVALQLDPLSPTIHDAAFYLYLSGRRWDKAQEMSDQLARLAPDDATPIYQTSVVHAIRGDCDGALNELTTLENRRRELVESEMSFLQGYVLGRCDKRREAIEYAHNLERDPNTLAISMAEIFAGLGDRANTLRWLEECYRRREPFITYIGVDPMLAPFRDDPRFKALLHQANYPEQWAARPR